MVHHCCIPSLVQQWKQMPPNNKNKMLTMKQKHYYGYTSDIEKWFSSSEVRWNLEREDIGRTHCVRSCIREPVLKLEDSRRIRCNSRICHTCVRILEELLIVVNSCVLNFECNKLPSWNRTREIVTISVNC
jgi:hypothetical protein